MKNITYILLSFAISFSILFSSCGSGGLKKVKELSDSTSVIANESDALFTLLEKSGNFINQKKIPTMLPVGKVTAGKKNFHIIDIRKHKDYVEGHLDGAVNVSLEELFDYMKNKISASTYEKIVFVCYSNHKASYAAMMFRLLGYDNVYSVKWGMSACNKATAEKKWMKNISNEFASKLETKGNPKGAKGNYPTIKTGAKTAYGILEARVKELLKKHNFKVKAKDVFADPSKYYIINYWKLADYAKGHIPGAVQYNPKKSLTRNSELSTLPTDKPIAVYCFTGQHAAFVTAYLQVLGYDAYVIPYSANGFMHNALNSLKIGHAYDAKKHFKQLPLVKGELPSIIVEEQQANDSEEEDNTAPIIIKKDEKEEEGGC